MHINNDSCEPGGDQFPDDDGPLDDVGRNEEVEADRTEAVPLQEGHEVAETDEDHHVHVLEHWNVLLCKLAKISAQCSWKDSNPRLSALESSVNHLY